MSKTVRIGVFIPYGAQLLDTACVDVLGVMSREYLSAIPQLPSHVAALAPEVSVAYITTPRQGASIPLTSGMTIRATHEHGDAAVAPGELDVVLVPGPDPSLAFDDEGALAWLRNQARTEGVDVLSICTGLFVCAAAGIADGKRASGPRGLQDMLKAKHPGIQLVGDEHRWVQDGNFWSSGGVTNGNDLMAAYARASKRWPQPVVEIGLQLTEVEDRGQFYDKGKGELV